MRSLEELRDEIDQIDQALIQLFEKRMHSVKEIALYKEHHHLPVFQPEREKIVIEKNLSYLTDQELDCYAREWVQKTIEESKNYQRLCLEKMK